MTDSQSAYVDCPCGCGLRVEAVRAHNVTSLPVLKEELDALQRIEAEFARRCEDMRFYEDRHRAAATTDAVWRVLRREAERVDVPEPHRFLDGLQRLTGIRMAIAHGITAIAQMKRYVHGDDSLAFDDSAMSAFTKRWMQEVKSV